MPRHFGKSKIQKTREPVIIEPQRRSLLDVFKKNLSLAKRVIYIHRYMYVGELCDDFSQKSLIELDSRVDELMRKNVAEINSGFTFERLSGIFLYYEKYFCHMVEGSESTINAHLATIVTKYGNYWKSIKLLAVVHHIQARFTNDWISYYGRPPTRVEEIDPQCNIDESIRYIKNCTHKFYQFATALVDDYNKAIRERQLRNNASSDNEINPAVMTSGILTRTTSNLRSTAPQESQVFLETYRKDLPEVELLHFLVNSKSLLDLTTFACFYGHVADIDYYEDRIWPLQCDFIPYNVFDKPHDPITDLPTKRHEVVAEEKEAPDDYETEIL